MDIDSSSLFMQNINSKIDQSKKYDDAIQKDYSKASESELMEACKTFEAYFIEQMYKSMEKTVPKSEFSSSGTQTSYDFFKEQMISEYAKMTSENGEGLGIAKMLFEQMKNNYGLNTTEEE